MKVTRVVYVISDIDKALAFEWIGKSLKADFDIHFILIGKSGSHLANALSSEGLNVIEIESTGGLSLISVFV